MNKMNKKGFTLIEMLVVIAIIAILVSIVIPVVGDSTEKAREARDAANIRAAITEVTAEGVSTGDDATTTVKLTQKGNFDKITEMTDIGGIALTEFASKTEVTIKYTYSNGTVSVVTK